MIDVRYRGPADRMLIGTIMVERDVVTRVNRADVDALGPKRTRVEIIPVSKPKRTARPTRRTRKET